MHKKEDKSTIWLRLLLNIDKLNRSVKEPGWSYEGKQAVYKLKDEIIRKILIEKPCELSLNLYYVPYYLYSKNTKDKAGAMMRQDLGKHPFEYYLAQMNPTAEDIEVPGKATVEVEVICMEQLFSFHMPSSKVEECGYSVDGMRQKAWISQSNFNEILLHNAQMTISSLLDHLK